MPAVLAVVAVGYFAGAIPFSYIAGRVFARIDLREHGSCNLGASNAFRFLGARVAGGVLVCDVAKGFLPVYFATTYAPVSAAPDHWLMILAAFSAIMGHMFSIFVHFRGGKGIATTAGAFLALAPLALLISLAVFGIVFTATRIVSAGSIAGAIALPVVVYFTGRRGWILDHWSLIALAIAIAVVVLVKHKSNIKRLLAGHEPALRRQKR